MAAPLLDEAGVAVVQASAFGLGPFLRIAYALDEVSLGRACTAIGGFVSKLQAV